MSKDFPGQNRGFAFVEFYNHACTQAAKNALSAPTYTCASPLGSEAVWHVAGLRTHVGEHSRSTRPFGTGPADGIDAEGDQ